MHRGTSRAESLLHLSYPATAPLSFSWDGKCIAIRNFSKQSKIVLCETTMAKRHQQHLINDSVSPVIQTQIHCLQWHIATACVPVGPSERTRWVLDPPTATQLFVWSHKVTPAPAPKDRRAAQVPLEGISWKQRNFTTLHLYIYVTWM